MEQLRNTLEKQERENAPVIKNGLEFKKLEHFPKYCKFECKKIVVSVGKNVQYINNWDFSKCTNVELSYINNIIIDNDTLKKCEISLDNCNHVILEDYNVRNIEYCQHCIIDTKYVINNVEHSAYMDICNTSYIKKIYNCKFSDILFEMNTSIDIDTCHNSCININASSAKKIPKECIRNCECSHIHFDYSICSISTWVIKNVIAVDNTRCKFEFSGYLLIDKCKTFIKGDDGSYYVHNDKKFVKK